MGFDTGWDWRSALNAASGRLSGEVPAPRCLYSSRGRKIIKKKRR
jgi:hypothetical protein